MEGALAIFMTAGLSASHCPLGKATFIEGKVVKYHRHFFNLFCSPPVRHNLVYNSEYSGKSDDTAWSCIC